MANRYAAALLNACPLPWHEQLQSLSLAQNLPASRSPGVMPWCMQT